MGIHSSHRSIAVISPGWGGERTTVAGLHVAVIHRVQSDFKVVPKRLRDLQIPTPDEEKRQPIRLGMRRG